MPLEIVLLKINSKSVSTKTVLLIAKALQPLSREKSERVGIHCLTQSPDCRVTRQIARRRSKQSFEVKAGEPREYLIFLGCAGASLGG